MSGWNDGLINRADCVALCWLLIWRGLQLEESEFAAREREIDEFQAERLAALGMALAERDRSNEYIAEVKIDHMRQTLLNQRDQKLAKLAQQRVKAMRKLQTQRQETLPASLRHQTKLTTRPGTRNIVDDYHTPHSEVYAPLRRSGVANAAPERNDVSKATNLPKSTIAMDDFTQSVNHLTRQMVVPKPRMEPRRSPKGAAERHEEHMRESLKLASSKFTQSTRSIADRLPSWRTEAKVERPATPVVEAASEEEKTQDDLQVALVMLQSLLRGRRDQNIMFQGREARLDLIRELQAGKGGQGPHASAQNPVQEAAAELEEDTQARRGEVGQSGVDTVAGAQVSGMLASFAEAEQERRKL